MQPYLAMIFVNTKTRADELHSYLTAQGLKVAKIHGDIAPRERKRIMNQVKNLDLSTLSQRIWPRVELILKVSAMLSMMPFRKICPSLFTVLDGLGDNGLPGTAITLYQPSDDSDIVSWRN